MAFTIVCLYIHAGGFELLHGAQKFVLATPLSYSVINFAVSFLGVRNLAS